MIWLLLLFPLIWPFIAKYFWPHELTWTEMCLNIIIVVALVTGVYQAGKYGKTLDTQILNGKILEKKREHGTYLQSYPCNCRTINKVTTCSTCYTRHYTVDWFARTSVGEVDFKHSDWTSPAVYALPDPTVYTNCVIGEPASVSNGYVNYVKAVPESLFNKHQETLLKYKENIPQYPWIYDFYKFNRVFSVGSPTGKEYNQKLNSLLNDQLRELGPSKQANIIVILTSIKDQSYRFAVENAWTGGKKNDIIVLIGLDNNKNIVWTDSITFALNTGNEFLEVLLRDDIMALKVLDKPEELSNIISRDIGNKFTRVSMDKFKYLEERIEPPLWVEIIAVMLAFFGSIGLTYYFTRYDVDINFT